MLKGETLTMTDIKIRLNTIADVNSFVATVSRVPYECDIVSGRYVVDAKSIMGILSLDSSKELDLHIYSDDCAALLEQLKPYTV